MSAALAEAEAAAWAELPLKKGCVTDGRYLAVFFTQGAMPADSAGLRRGSSSRIWATCRDAVPPQWRFGANGVRRQGLIFLLKHFNHGFRGAPLQREAIVAYSQALDAEEGGPSSSAEIASYYAACAAHRCAPSAAQPRGYLSLFRDDAVPKRFVTDSHNYERLVASATGVVLTCRGLMQAGWDHVNASRDVLATWSSETCRRKCALYERSVFEAGRALYRDGRKRSY